MANQESAPLEHDLGLVADAKAINARMYTVIWQGCEQHLRPGLQKLLSAVQDTQLADPNFHGDRVLLCMDEREDTTDMKPCVEALLPTLRLIPCRAVPQAQI
jgi:hypothetical protein